MKNLAVGLELDLLREFQFDAFVHGVKKESYGEH